MHCNGYGICKEYVQPEEKTDVQKKNSGEYALVFMMKRFRFVTISVLFVRFPIDVLLDENVLLFYVLH